MTEVNADNFQAEVIESPVVVVVHFYESYSPVCRMMMARSQELAGEFLGKVKIVGADVGRNEELVTNQGLTRAPAFLVFKKGREVARQYVPHSKERLREVLRIALQE